MKEESRDILLQIINNQFREFKESVCKAEIEDDPVGPYDITKIHRIKTKEFEQEGYYMIICTQAMSNKIDQSNIEIWKVYKTEKYRGFQRTLKPPIITL